MDRKAFSLINILRNIVTIYFDVFFVIYFLNIVNYNIFHFAMFYLIVFITILLSFWFLSTSSRLKYKVYYYRIGLSLTALYLALIMLFREDIVNYLYLVAIVKGLGEGFYFYPRNILNSTKISNKERKKYNGLMSAINGASAILVPLLLGVLLTYYSYVDIGKIVFILMIVMFILSFYVKDDDASGGKISLIKFYKHVKKDSLVQSALIMQFLQGFTIGSGVLVGVMTIYKVLYFESNLYIGILNSLLGILTVLTSIVYAHSKKEKYFKPISVITLVLMSISLVLLGISANNVVFIIYLIVYAIGITLISLTADNIIVNASNHIYVRFHRAEYHLLLETLLDIARIIGYSVLLCVGITGRIELMKFILFYSIVPLTILVIYVINTKDKEVKDK